MTSPSESIDCKIIVATHKRYDFPNDKLYLPVQVGAALTKDRFGYATDDTGDNISTKNKGFCELTALYWGWKNLPNEYIGLDHYRRYLSAHPSSGSREKRLRSVLSSAQVNDLLAKEPVILPKKRHYYIENLYDHYAHTMYVKPLDITGEIIQDKHPEYSPEFQRLHRRTSAHMFNMFIMRRDILNGYCQWLFDILFELERRVDADKYDAFHARFYGRISELLLDVYLNTNELEYTEVPVVNIEPVNWAKKGTSFLKAKFMGEKYDQSF